jgi:hypothetical protein
MAAWRQAIELALGEADVAALSAIPRSRTDPANRVERAQMLLAYRDEPSFFAVAQVCSAPTNTARSASAMLIGAALDIQPQAQLDKLRLALEVCEVFLGAPARRFLAGAPQRGATRVERHLRYQAAFRGRRRNRAPLGSNRGAARIERLQGGAGADRRRR